MVIPRLFCRTMGFVDEDCEVYCALFADVRSAGVRSYECFQYLRTRNR